LNEYVEFALNVVVETFTRWKDGAVDAVEQQGPV
jgi:hypothetical protein